VSAQDRTPLSSAVYDAGARFDNVFYSKSDEKFTVRALLEEILGDRHFELTLDVGPGAGHVSEPLARRSKSIIMVEKSPEFSDLLRQRFENARVIVSSISNIDLPSSLDVVLFLHVLYYQPIDTWVPLMRTLHQSLKPGGELILALNSDSGDWWKIVSEFSGDLRPHMGFHYTPLSALRKELMTVGQLQLHPYRYQMWIDAQTTWSDFVGKQILELSDPQILQENAERFKAFTKPFKQVDGNFVLDMRAEIIRIRKD
jgi:SAM-dependent methyltransferase